MEEETKALESQLESLCLEQKQLEQQIADEYAEVFRLESQEATHYRQYAELKQQLIDAEQNERSVMNRIAHSEQQLSILRRTNAVNLVCFLANFH